ncbi:MAG: hypothetical protein NC191_07205 [Muribaculaceae bacterium]|nr:hypothetical protein [Muribaculaceae bacterium]
MNNNINSTNQPAFQARLNVQTAVKNGKRLANIQELFAQKTARYADDTMHLRAPEEGLGSEQVYLQQKGEFDPIPQFLTRSLDELMESSSDNDIAKKLVRLFKSLKADRKYSDQILSTSNNIDHVKGLSKFNIDKAKFFREKGDLKMAERYENISSANDRRVETLKSQLESIKNIRDKVLTKIAKGDSDLEENLSVVINT